MKSKYLLFTVVFYLFLGYQLTYSETCCDQITVNAYVTADCCLKLVVSNPYCDGVYYQFQQYDENLGTWINEARLGPIGTSSSDSYTMCVLDGQTTITFRILLQTEQGGNFCSVASIIEATRDMSDCCSCPEDVNSWLTLEVDDDSPDCPDGCKVTPHLNIPDSVTCYKNYVVWNDNGEPTTPISMSTPIEDSYVCIDRGEVTDFWVFLMKGDTWDEDDWDVLYCRSEVVSEPCVETPPEPCYPDCPEDLFTERATTRFLLGSCPGCFVDVTYTWREPTCYFPTKYYDLQILAIDFPNGECDPSCTIQSIYKDVLVGVMYVNKMGFPPAEDSDTGYVWRVANGGCWGKQHLYWKEGPTQGTREEVVRWHPCEGSFCCLQEMLVERIEGGGLRVTPIDTTFYPADSCDGLTTIGADSVVYDCIPACHWAGEVDGEFGEPQLGKRPAQEFIEYKKDYSFAISTRTLQDIFEVSIVNNEGSKVDVMITDLLGNVVERNQHDLKKGN